MLVKVCAGIGDNIWLMQKLVNAGQKFDFSIANENPRRGHQLFELLPQVTNSFFYGSHDSNDPLHKTITNVEREFGAISKCYNEIWLSANKHLESGKRIETFLSDLKTSYSLDYNTGQYADQAKILIPNKSIGLYTSSYSMVRHWKFWEEEEWRTLVRLISRAYGGKDLSFVLIGADFDIDMVSNLKHKLIFDGVQLIEVIGQPLGLVVEVMKRLKYLFAFPSGIGILAGTLGVPCTMFYPPHLDKLMGTWVDLSLVESKIFKEALFCSPESIFDWMIKEYRIVDKLDES
jgi:hypothetical protein